MAASLSEHKPFFDRCDVDLREDGLAWSYDHVPGFAAISEGLYKLIACRIAGSPPPITRLALGKRCPAANVFCRATMVSALSRFDFPDRIRFALGPDRRTYRLGRNHSRSPIFFRRCAHNSATFRALSILPTLCWLNSSDSFLHFLCGGGVLLSLLLIFGIAPGALARRPGCCLIFRSTIAGQTFLSFQWDILLTRNGIPLDLSRAVAALVEVIFCGGSRVGCKFRASGRRHACHYRAAGFARRYVSAQALAFQTDVDVGRGEAYQWRRFVVGNLTALDYHYWSQPLPTVFGWWADQEPGMVQEILGGVLPCRRNHRAVFHLGAAPSALDRLRVA